MGSSLNEWFFGGYFCIHSIDEGLLLIVNAIRFDNIDSHMIIIIIIILIIEIILPIDEIKFHVIYISGYAEYRRGNPDNPKKCWGKNVKFTPINIDINWIFSHL